MTNNVISLQRGNDSALQAQEWVVRIDSGRLTAQERQDLQAWLAEDAAHAKLLDTHALLWCEAARAKFPPIASGSVDPDKPKAQSFVTGRGAPALAWVHGKKSWYLAGLLALGMAFVLWGTPIRSLVDSPGAARELPKSITTDIGRHLEVPLADGSLVHLNTASAIQVAYSKERRRVVLDKGEGLFDVAKDAQRPFEVVAGSTTVRAIGTRFSVLRLPDGRTDVTVFEGIVEILKGQTAGTEQPLRLGAGQTATAQADKIVLQQLAKPALENKLAWRDDRIIFDSVSLGEAVAQVNRYSLVPLRITGPELMDLHVSGAFSTADVPVFVRSLEQGFGLHVERTDEAYLISKSSVR
jgi:transmembrane sensor